jgi:uncharacterized protein YjdB
VTSIAVAPATDTLVSLGETTQLTATARDANGGTVAGVSFTWSSSDEDCAAVSSAGLVTGRENGTVTITASAGAASGTAAVTVAQVAASVEVTPPSVSLASLGETSQLTATAQDANGNAVAGAAFTWTSSDEDVVVVNTSGLVTALANGTADVTVSTTGVAIPDTAEITVVQQADSVVVSPAGASISGVGTEQQFSVAAWDVGGSPIASPVVTWSSLNPNVATIDPSSGAATAVEGGQVTIAATANAATGYALLTVAVPGAEPVNLWSEMWRGNSNERAMGIWGTSATDIYAVGDFPEIRHYDGTSWDPMGGTFGGAMWGTSATDIYFMGWTGTVLHYDGTSWSPMESGTGSTLNSVWGASPHDVYAVGDAGAIIRYDGTSWSDMASGTFEDLTGVWGMSATDVYAVGGSGTILHYDGTSWSAVASGTSADFTAIWGTSATDIFAVGQWPDIILRYNGTSWNPMPSASMHRPEALWGSSATDIYLVGFAGSVLRYDGTSWSEMESGIGNDLNGVWGTSAAHVYVVGGSSLILRGVRGAAVAVSPDAHTLTAVGETIQLAASARDAADNPVGGVTFAWKSSDLSVATVDAIGLVTAAAEGTAEITATAPGGAADTTTITVARPQGSPSAAITSPANGASYAVGETVTFTGSGTDQEDGDLTGTALTWTSSLDGQIGTGTSFTKNDLSVGTHTITLTAMDSDNNTGNATLTITVATLGAIVPGVWHATTGDGFSFDFTVSAGADRVEQIQYFWSGLSCEGVTRVSGSVTVSSNRWSITGRQFTVDPQDEPEISGTFDSNGTTASGTWEWLSCSGTWTATP